MSQILQLLILKHRYLYLLELDQEVEDKDQDQGMEDQHEPHIHQSKKATGIFY